MDSHLLIGFVLAALVVLLIPGPGVFYVVTRSVTQGRAAGLVSVLGLCAGAFVHVIAATAGLSAILLTSAVAFGIVKIAGVCYLVYLGVRSLVTRYSLSDTTVLKPDSPRKIFIDGVMISVLNPKIAIFFLAFLPHFIVSEQGAIPFQFLFLGLLYIALAFCTDGMYALLADSVRRMINRRINLGQFPRYASGLVYIGLGLSLAFSDRKV